MSNPSPELIVAAPAAVAALLYTLKRFCSADLEVRTHRERQRMLYLSERARRQALQDDLLNHIDNSLAGTEEIPLPPSDDKRFLAPTTGGPG